MKIGILTYHRSENYGAVLQALALNKAVRRLGFKPVFVDYQHPRHKELYSLFSWSKFEKFSLYQKLKYLLVFLFTYTRKLRRKSYFQRFFNQYFETDNLGSIADHYDIVIYGSDQIWRKQNIIGVDGFLDIYFGSDAISVKKKIAYAASMGVIRLGNDDYDFLKSSFSNFNAISVREDDLKELVTKTTGIVPAHVVDPVFLLDKEEWKGIASPLLLNEKYILFYCLGESQEASRAVDRLRRETGFEVVEINGRIITRESRSQRWNVVGPSEFLSLVMYAEIVITSSFHGLSFSLLFNKSFFVFIVESPRRIESMLKDLGLESRIMKDAEEVDLMEKIEWPLVNKKMENRKKMSMGYLIKELK